MSAKRGYVVAIRRNGSLYGCMGPYTTRKAAETEAAALPMTRGSEAVVLGVRDNGFSEAWSRLSGAYREAGRATVEAGREAVKGVREAPGRAAAAARKRAQDAAAEARRRVEAAAEKRREQAAISLAEQIEALGYEVTLRRVRKNSHALVALEAAHMAGEVGKAAGRAGKATVREASRAASDAGDALAEIVRAAAKRANRRTKAR